MALPSFVDSTPRAYRLKAGNADLPISTRTGTSPADAQRVLTILRESGRPPFETLSPLEAREIFAAGRTVLQRPPEEVAEVHSLNAPGPAGPVPLRLYRGVGTAPDEVLPCLLFMHGGGWVVGNLDSHDNPCRRLANAARCCVISVDYRLAPEHPFPAAVEDAAASLIWTAARAKELRIDPARIAVGGDSAGGNLAAVLALMGRDGSAPASVFQVLLYPVVDLCMTAESYERPLEGTPLTAETMRWFIGHYAPDASQRLDWRASPLRASSLAGAPPALVLTVTHDPLCDEARAYAHRLEREGVRVTALHYSDQIHGLLTMDLIIGTNDALVPLIAETLRYAWCNP